MRRICVCHLITELAPAGAERIVCELARRLDRDRFEVVVAGLRGGAAGDRLARDGIETHVIGVRGKWDVLKLSRLVRLLRRRRVDILHTHLFHADLAGRAAAWLAGVPHVVHTIHTAEARFRPWQFAFARLAAGRCDRLIAVSRTVGRYHARKSGLPLAGYAVIPNGVDLKEYCRDERRRRELRERLGLSSGTVVAAFVGRLAEEKGVDVLLAAMRLLADRASGIHLIVAGDGPKRAIVERFLAARAGAAITFLGFTDDVRAVLSAADMLVMPSRWEGFPLTVAEAMAAGLPVVATGAGGLADVVLDGQTGLLIEKEDPPSLADAMTKLAQNAELRLRLGAAGRKRVEDHFTIDRLVGAYEGLYVEVCRPHGPS